MTITEDTSVRERDRSADAIAAMSVGLLLTVAATVAPYVDRATGHMLADHVRDGYPTYGPERVDEVVATWITVLTTVGVLGVAGWITAIWAVATHRPWAGLAAIGLLLIGTGLTLASLMTKDSSGDVGLVPILGWIGLAPSVPGLATVAMLSARGDAGARRSGAAAGNRPESVAPQRTWNA